MHGCCSPRWRSAAPLPTCRRSAWASSAFPSAGSWPFLPRHEPCRLVLSVRIRRRAAGCGLHRRAAGGQNPPRRLPDPFGAGLPALLSSSLSSIMLGKAMCGMGVAVVLTASMALFVRWFRPESCGRLCSWFFCGGMGAGNRAHGGFPPDAHLSWAERPKKSEMNQTFRAVPGAPQPGRTRQAAFPRSSAGRCPSGDAIPVPPECESRRRPQRARGRRDGPGESPAGGGNPSFVKNNTLRGTKIDALMNRNVQRKSESAFPSAAARIKPF